MIELDREHTDKFIAPLDLMEQLSKPKRIEEKHGSHNQASHGRRGGGRSGGGASVVKRMAKGEAVTISPDELSSVLNAAADMPATNLQRLSVSGKGNENLFAAHLRELDRSKMPQLPRDAEGMQKFREHLDKKGLKYRVENVDPRSLRSTQNVLDSQKVAQIHKRFVETGGFRTGDTLLASREGGVLDGHHRFAAVAAFAVTNPGTRVNVLRIDARIDTVLSAAHEFGS